MLISIHLLISKHKLQFGREVVLSSVVRTKNLRHASVSSAATKKITLLGIVGYWWQGLYQQSQVENKDISR